MLHYKKNIISEGIDINKTNVTKNICPVIIGTSNMLDLNSI